MCIPYIWFWFASLDDEWCWTPFQVPVIICMSSLKKYSFRFSARFFNGSFVFCYWVTWFPPLLTNPIWHMVCKYFPHAIGYLFILFLVSLLCRNFLDWCSPTCLFLLLLLAFGVTSKKSLPRRISKKSVSLFFF